MHLLADHGYSSPTVSSNGSGEPTPDVLIASLVTLKEMEEKYGTFSVKELL